MAETNHSKDVIYIDADEEITGVIDKVRSAKRQIVALVLPKRATVLQSIVNMKLLKRTADEAKKHVVLITSEEGLLPLAGSVGMHVAHSLQTKPEIPAAPPKPDMQVEDVQEPISMGAATSEDGPLDASRSIGELSGLGAAAEEAPIELDNGETPPPDTAERATKSGKKANKSKKLKVPNFNKFRSWLLLGGVGLVVLVFLLYISLAILPKATITISTNSQTINASVQLTLNTSANTVNPGAQVAPAQISQTQKTYSGQANATGQQNNGQKASGSVGMSAGPCSGSVPADVPAGTGLSANGLTFITQSDASFVPSVSHKQCVFVGETGGGSTSIGITAQNGGSNYNLNSTNFSVSGRSDVSSSGSTSGGTDNVTQIVQQADVDSAKAKITPDSDAIKSQLQSDLQSQGLYPIPATFTSTPGNVSTSVTVGSAASSVTVTESVSYSMFGAKQSDLDQIIASSVNSQINANSQKILDYGLSKATFNIQNQTPGSALLTMQTGVLVGSGLDAANIKKQSAGEKPGTAESTIRGYPGVTSVTVHLSPFWVSSIPKSTSKITVKIENPNSK